MFGFPSVLLKQIQGQPPQYVSKYALPELKPYHSMSTLDAETRPEIWNTQDELLKSRKWSARRKDAQDKFRRVWEARGDEYARSQRGFEEAKAARNERMRERREMEAEQVKQQKK